MEQAIPMRTEMLGVRDKTAQVSKHLRQETIFRYKGYSGKVFEGCPCDGAGPLHPEIELRFKEGYVCLVDPQNGRPLTAINIELFNDQAEEVGQAPGWLAQIEPTR